MVTYHLKQYWPFEIDLFIKTVQLFRKKKKKKKKNFAITGVGLIIKQYLISHMVKFYIILV